MNIPATVITAVLCFGITALLGFVAIPALRKLKFGQTILDIGPAWHKSKNGTPTMGGIMFIVAMAIAILVTTVIFAMNGNFNTTYARCIVLFVISLGFGVIGFVDDYIKVVKKRNLGLTAPQKFIMQVVLAAIYIAVLYFIGELDTAIKIPFTSIEWTMPIWLYIPFVMFVVVGVVNAVNLTDGLDGLASSITTIVGIFFMLVSYIVFKEYGVTVFSAALIGGLIGFLWYNKYPAKVFMGDTGSLALGGGLAAAAILMKLELLLPIVGLLYVIEALSVVLQVGYFKISGGKRIFKMAPIHHHFEKCGFSEVQVVAGFWIFAVLCCVAGFFII